ncbi:MAG: hypothetical protein ISS70_19470 [Phycisphaerae bacterium]|nr:hypothetical protein [Phycisphaerae bacterium]
MPKTIEKLTLTTHLTVFLVVCLLSLPVPAQYGGGTGKPNDPYLIYTAEQMNEIGANWRNDWDKHFKLMADIDMSAYAGRDFKIIGSNSGNAFRGVFDGNGKIIRNFTYSSTRRDYAGLFGYIKGWDAEIRNLGLVSPNVDAGSGSYVGSLVGYTDEGTVTNCYALSVRVSGGKRLGGLIGYARRGAITNCRVEGGSVRGDEEVGGLVGYNRTDIENCHSTCVVSGGTKIGGLIGRSDETVADSAATGTVSAGGDDAGGLVGDNLGLLTNCSARGRVRGSRRVGGLVGDNSGSITNCRASGEVSGSDSVGGLAGSTRDETISDSCASGAVTGAENVGGLAGYNRKTIENCYATGSVTGKDCVGGLVGKNTWPAKINCCYSIGSVFGTTDVGGLVGFNDEGIVKTSLWDTQTSGRSNMCGRQELGIGCDNAGGKTTAEMQRRSTFPASDWDFASESANGVEGIWSICDGLEYPQLARQFLTADFDGDNRVDLTDFAFFAERWRSTDSSFFWCRGADLTGDRLVGVDDLSQFADNWLAEGLASSAPTVYLIVDDFESYNDLDPGDPESNRIFNVWSDGYDNPAANGSIVGHANPPFAERYIVHSGVQSMPYLYHTLFKLAKAELALSPSQNWAEERDGALSLWFCGDSSNAAAPMSVILNGDSAVYHNDPDATRIDTWTQWSIDLQAFTRTDLANVDSIAICFGDQNNLQPGGSGIMFFDDIRLYGPG